MRQRKWSFGFWWRVAGEWLAILDSEDWDWLAGVIVGFWRNEACGLYYVVDTGGYIWLLIIVYEHDGVVLFSWVNRDYLLVYSVWFFTGWGSLFLDLQVLAYIVWSELVWWIVGDGASFIGGKRWIKGYSGGGNRGWQWRDCWPMVGMTTLVRGWSMAESFKHREEDFLAEDIYI